MVEKVERTQLGRLCLCQMLHQRPRVVDELSQSGSILLVAVQTCELVDSSLLLLEQLVVLGTWL
jgi:hypothetical protein